MTFKFLTRKLVARSITLVLSCLLIAACGWFGARVPWEEQEPVYSMLLQVSAIVFGVMGAWVAILYPNDLRQLVRAGNTGSPEVRRVKRYLTAMIWATGIVAATLLVQLLAPIAKQVDILGEWRALVRSVSMGFVALLVVVQLWTLVLTLLPIDHLDGKISRAVQSGQSLQRRKGVPGRRKR